MPGGKHVLGQGKNRVFGTARVGDRGQIVIPQEARRYFGISPGDTLLDPGQREKRVGGHQAGGPPRAGGRDLRERGRERCRWKACMRQLGISQPVYEYGEKILAELRPRFDGIDQVAEYNQAKVVAAMQKNRVNATHFAATTGYGYDDEGRDNLERVYADVFHTEAALVRPQITCGTHALAVALSANLLPGDELLSPVGAPYDTLEEVIGIRESRCSLKEYGVTYAQADLKPDGTFDYDAIREKINGRTKLITIQRSKGYATRPSFSVRQIGELIAFCKEVKPGREGHGGQLLRRVRGDPSSPPTWGRTWWWAASSRTPAAASPPSAATSAAPRSAWTAAPSGSPPRAWGRRSARTWVSCPPSTRGCSWPPRWSPAR